MRYYVTIEGRTLEVDLSGAVPIVDGDALHAELTAVPGTPIRHLLVDGRSHVVVAEPGPHPGEWRLRLNGTIIDAGVVDERTRAIRAMTGGPGAGRGPSPLRAPMPGMVVRVEVEPGQRVERGQGLVIVEAMKMENELRAEVPGVVARVLANTGQAVEKGAILIEFEADADARAEEPAEAES